MTKDKVSMPTSSAGITRYFDEYHSKISFKPEYIIVLVFIVILIVLMLHKYGNSLFGL